MCTKYFAMQVVFVSGLILTGCTDSRSRWAREAMDDMMSDEEAFVDPAIEPKPLGLSDKSALGDDLVYAALNNAALKLAQERALSNKTQWFGELEMLVGRKISGKGNAEGR